MSAFESLQAKIDGNRENPIIKEVIFRSTSDQETLINLIGTAYDIVVDVYGDETCFLGEYIMKLFVPAVQTKWYENAKWISINDFNPETEKEYKKLMNLPQEEKKHLQKLAIRFKNELEDLIKESELDVAFFVHSPYSLMPPSKKKFTQKKRK